MEIIHQRHQARRQAQEIGQGHPGLDQGDLLERDAHLGCQGLAVGRRDGHLAHARPGSFKQVPWIARVHLALVAGQGPIQVVMPQNEARGALGLRKIVEGGGEGQVLGHGANVVGDEHVRAIQGAVQVGFHQAYQRLEIRRHFAGREAGAHLEHLRVARIQARQHVHRDARIPGGAPPGNHVHQVPGTRQLLRLAGDRRLHAPHQGRGGIVKQCDLHGPLS